MKNVNKKPEENYCGINYCSRIFIDNFGLRLDRKTIHAELSVMVESALLRFKNCNQRGEINVANLWRHIQYISHVKMAF